MDNERASSVQPPPHVLMHPFLVHNHPAGIHNDWQTNFDGPVNFNWNNLGGGNMAPPSEIDPFGNIIPLDADPRNVFAPFNYDSLQPFAAETVMRVITVPGRLLSFVGLIYPAATFVVSRFPASQNTTTRMTGHALAKLSTLMPDMAVNEMYTVCLRRRDWPCGSVARIPDTPQAQHMVTEMLNVFEKISGEVWRFKRYAVTTPDNDTATTCVKVMRSYQGPYTSHGHEDINAWLDEHSGVVEEDAVGARILEHMTLGEEIGLLDDGVIDRDWKPRPVIAQHVVSATPAGSEPTPDVPVASAAGEETRSTTTPAQSTASTTQKRGRANTPKAGRRSKARAGSQGEESDYAKPSTAGAVMMTAAASRSKRKRTQIKREEDDD